ncbi:MAG: TatD family hydrolase [Chromatiaceae bacterium]|nr:TatD family hydrolase [Gammaproteobacteria bacterium]MCB1879175.1 TatD family hydrolase [Gammaproteobacteria bacterium]MCB1904907.1 TatD family hydrolase [Gammaproteobacteria bacterium]MCP5445560.1 TatD family hydrolase [Chromatiaceae bacterium]
MLVDSHCHLDRLDLAPFDNDFNSLISAAAQSGVTHMLCVCIDLESYPAMLALVEPYPQISVSVGIHPNDKERREPEPGELEKLASHPRNVAIGETGLDYFRSAGDLTWQQQRFRHHIAAARTCGKPLIIHTRAAKADTIAIMTEERAADAGGVMHCFTEDWEMAKKALDLGFYISFSGIITFNSATELREVARKVPAERLLIETDAPYLAPVPFRGKSNLPQYVSKVAECVAELRGISVAEAAEISSRNFFNLFPAAQTKI